MSKVCVFLLRELWIDADLVDDSKYSVRTSAQDGISRVEGRQARRAGFKVRTKALSLLHWTV